MKHFIKTIFALFLCSNIHSMYAQSKMIVGGGTVLSTTNGAVITLQNTDLVNNGIINQPAGAGKFIFSGTASDTLSGSVVPVIDMLEINKTGGSLNLGQNVNIGSGIHFVSGLINLNGDSIKLLSPAAMLNGESETSRISGTSGGAIVSSSAAMNAPSQQNLSNLGAAITSAQNLGNVQITRSHVAAVNPNNNSFTGVQRTFFIQPSNDAGLNATLRFYYFNAELNGKDANTLGLWKSTDGINWNVIGADTRDAANKFVEKNGIADFSYWTLSDAEDLLPIKLSAFSAVCKDNNTLVEWKTSSELNIASFVVEKSTDGSNWQEIQTVVAIGNPSGSAYSCKDANPQPNAIYQLKIITTDGAVSYSPSFSGNCDGAAMPFVVYPNPAKTTATARISVRQATKSSITVYNSAGQSVKQYNWNLQIGVNTFNLYDLSMLPSGVYIVRVLFNNNSYETELIKQ